MTLQLLASLAGQFQECRPGELQLTLCLPPQIRNRLSSFIVIRAKQPNSTRRCGSCFIAARRAAKSEMPFLSWTMSSPSMSAERQRSLRQALITR
jgi:hypothetical protein